MTRIMSLLPGVADLLKGSGMIRVNAIPKNGDIVPISRARRQVVNGALSLYFRRMSFQGTVSPAQRGCGRSRKGAGMSRPLFGCVIGLGDGERSCGSAEAGFDPDG